MKQEPSDTVLIKHAAVEAVDDTDAGGAAPDDADLTAIAEMLRQVTGENAAWAERIGPESRLEGDLGIDSLELAELDGNLRARYGSGVDLMAKLAELDIDQIIDLTVGDLLAYLADAGRSSESSGSDRTEGQV